MLAGSMVSSRSVRFAGAGVAAKGEEDRVRWAAAGLWAGLPLRLGPFPDHRRTGLGRNWQGFMKNEKGSMKNSFTPLTSAPGCGLHAAARVFMNCCSKPIS